MSLSFRVKDPEKISFKVQDNKVKMNVEEVRPAFIEEPAIDGVTLQGDLTLAELGIAEAPLIS